MGRVWLGRDEMLRRDVAVKELVPPPGLTVAARDELRERSMREARAIARIDQANVVRIFDVVHDGGEPWIVMEFVPSRSLDDLLAEDGPLPPRRVARIGVAVLAALRAAHRVGITHRDVKPANILLGEDGRVVLTDFGVAAHADDPSMTQTGVVLGSPEYVAPERATDGVGGPAADLWSLGATLYTAVEGQAPFRRSTSMATLVALATEEPAPANRAGPLTGALDGLLRKDVRRRIDGAEAARRLSAAAGGGKAFPSLVTVRWWLRSRSRRHRGWLLVGASALLLLAALVAPAMLLGRTGEHLPGTGGQPGRHIVHTASGRCVDVPGADPETKSPVRLWRCTGGPGTRFTFPTDGTVRVLGRCLEPGSPALGSGLRIAACNGTDAQLFTVTQEGALIHRSTSRCIEPATKEAGEGTWLRTWDCAGTPAQRWHLD
jgi:hypothetical protein